MSRQWDEPSSRTKRAPSLSTGNAFHGAASIVGGQLDLTVPVESDSLVREGSERSRFSEEQSEGERQRDCSDPVVTEGSLIESSKSSEHSRMNKELPFYG